MILASEAIVLIQGFQWFVLLLLVTVGAAFFLLGYYRFPWKRNTRRCPKCVYDMRATPSLRCSECGYQASDESELRRGKRNRLLCAAGLLMIISYPGYRLVLWSRDRGWSPPLSTWRVAKSFTIPSGAEVEILEHRDPHEYGKRCQVRSSDGSIWSIDDYRFYFGFMTKDHSRRHLGVGDDITGDGNPNLVVSIFSGGPHCCMIENILSFQPDGSIEVIGTVDARDGGWFEDVDGDGSYEYVMKDLSLSYGTFGFNTKAVNYPIVILSFNGSRYVLAGEMMRMPAPTPEERQQLVTRIRSGEWHSYMWGKCQLWSDMLHLIYTGNEKVAFQLFDEAWPPGIEGREESLARFMKALKQSPYRAEILDMQ